LRDADNCRFHPEQNLALTFFVAQVSQTPWNEAHGDVRHSVQSLIVAVVGSQYEAEHIKFMGAGREDLDVRMLGTGRPFLLEFVNARSLPTAPHIRVGKEEVADRDATFSVLEDKVNQSTGLIEIRELRSVGKEWVKMLKNAGESKVKTYQAVVWMERPVSAAALQLLSDKAPFNIDQTTPIRVLHRRSLAVRKRMVHKIKCEAINPHFMIITLSTEAGTVTTLPSHRKILEVIGSGLLFRLSLCQDFFLD
jgi:tRNA pseudouridine synthase 10